MSARDLDSALYEPSVAKRRRRVQSHSSFERRGSGQRSRSYASSVIVLSLSAAMMSSEEVVPVRQARRSFDSWAHSMRLRDVRARDGQLVVEEGHGIVCRRGSGDT